MEIMILVEYITPSETFPHEKINREVYDSIPPRLMAPKGSRRLELGDLLQGSVVYPINGEGMVKRVSLVPVLSSE